MRETAASGLPHTTMSPAALRFACVCIGLAQWSHAAREIEVRHGPYPEGTMTLEQYSEMTGTLTRPIILKRFFDPTKFDFLCSCADNVSMFDKLAFPHNRGNAKVEEWSAMTYGQQRSREVINGGDFYRERACSGLDEYVFLDANQNVYLSGPWRAFFSQLSSLLRVEETITDPRYNGWVHEFFLGYSSRDYPFPAENASGSPPHRFPVLNYYYQICGKKKWNVALHDASMGAYDTGYWMLNVSDMESYVAHPDVLEGYTEPGDVLLNPPWLWHLVRTAKGFNFATVYKQMKYGVLADLHKQQNPKRAELLWNLADAGGTTKSAVLTNVQAVLLLASSLVFGIVPGHPWYRPFAVPVSRCEFLHALVSSDHPLLEPLQTRLKELAARGASYGLTALTAFWLGRRWGRRGAAERPGGGAAGEPEARMKKVR